jgi:hypothetical protein
MRKCSRCQARNGRVEVVVTDSHSRTTYQFCPFHAERILYILRVYVEAPAHQAKPNPREA